MKPIIHELRKAVEGWMEYEDLRGYWLLPLSAQIVFRSLVRELGQPITHVYEESCNRDPEVICGLFEYPVLYVIILCRVLDASPRVMLFEEKECEIGRVYLHNN